MAGRGDHRLRVVVLVALALLVQAVLPAAPTAASGVCLEYDADGRCIRWSDGTVIVEDLPAFPVPYEAPPADAFTVYALTSPCGGGGPPGQQQTYRCGLHRSCADDPDRRRYEVWKQLKRKQGERWEPSTGWEYLGLWCLNREEGGDHHLFDPGTKWISYITFLPPGTPRIEPAQNGMTLLNKATNFYVPDAETEPIVHVLNLGLTGPMLVRATPVEYHWDFGDDTQLDTTRTGLPYRHGQGTEEDDFEVSHTYDKTGTYDVRLQITYQMEYDTGDGWSAGPRYRSAPANPETIRVVQGIPVIIG